MQQNTGRSVMVQGRIVWVSGDLFKGKVKVDLNTKLARLNKKGETMMEYGFGLAVQKSLLGQNGPGQPGEIWAAMYAEACTLYPNGQIPPSFAMKYKDGDTIDDKGAPFAQREGYAGHLVFACTTSIPIKFFKFENGQNILVNEGIGCGDYVRAQLHVKAHPASGQGKAGLYLNPNAVQFLGYGKPIVNAPSGDQIFGGALPAMPDGASNVPVAPTIGLLVPTANPGFAQHPGGFPQQPMAPQYPAQPPPGYPAASMPQPATPHYPVLPQQFQPPPGGAPVPQQYASPVAPTQAAPFPQQPTGMPPFPGGYPQPH